MTNTMQLPIVLSSDLPTSSAVTDIRPTISRGTYAFGSLWVVAPFDRCRVESNIASIKSLDSRQAKDFNRIQACTKFESDFREKDQA